MARATKTAEVQTTLATENSEEQVRITAYYDWERTTGGNPVDEETTRQFWLEAEQRVSHADKDS
jgi:hypothetical protein